MKGPEKDAVMARFPAGRTGVLVATTVIEVGVDVPNATLMIVEGRSLRIGAAPPAARPRRAGQRASRLPVAARKRAERDGAGDGWR
jgi:hypothetical protein